MAAQQRPLSPHLQIYRRQITTVMSIMHRATGVLLALGAFALMAWLVASAGDGESFACFQSMVGSPIGKIALFAFAAALVYHFLNGIRHLLWDVGWGFEIPRVYASGYVVLALTVIITAALAYVALNAGGAA
jgi:succinate dehydrogenase / fumarate reductase cytochrome b subunit